jgi:hypothetical protein
MSDDPEAQISEPAETSEDPKPDETGADEDPNPDESSEENPKPENEDPEKTETEGGSRPASSTVVGLFFLCLSFGVSFCRCWSSFLHFFLVNITITKSFHNHRN